MPSDSFKIIAVIGATGNQGSSVAKTFAALPHWRVRCITRNVESEKAKELHKLGCELVQGDLDDESSLLKAFQDVHAVFVNTDFWGQYREGLQSNRPHDEVCKASYDMEVRHGINAFRAAAKIPTIERYVYSALGPMKRASHGKYTKSFHWETKAAIVDFICSQHNDQELSSLAEKSSLIYVGCFTTNVFLRPQLDPKDGSYKVVYPGPATTTFPIIDPCRSTGPFVRALVEDKAPGARLLACDEELTLKECFDLWSNYTGKSYTFRQVTLEEMHEITGKPYEILHGAAFLAEYEYTAGVPRAIKPEDLKHRPKTDSYEDFVKRQTMGFLLDQPGASPK
ncbi:hypothetical protein BD324DRAFT_683175 [Kockovaella imperatae]|uniref:NmrA-like domain-containing protein n=1 Tax=Kockovaella imperatae TaxID=4999 RepID=A0A1Y1UB56_9TREE|nr:hypothetical protein BD324DRAFT_683175 [Kockovaella imperatae]ORX34736.1 hypothetical protein BD324DRAFT_683175 [Kockovaella imperatae]